MKLPSIGLAFFGLAVIVLIGHVLNRRLYIGSTIRTDYVDAATPQNKEPMVRVRYYKT
jgi:hypothetical protein